MRDKKMPPKKCPVMCKVASDSTTHTQKWWWPFHVLWQRFYLNMANTLENVHGDTNTWLVLFCFFQSDINYKLLLQWITAVQVQCVCVCVFKFKYNFTGKYNPQIYFIYQMYMQLLTVRRGILPLKNIILFFLTFFFFSFICPIAHTLFLIRNFALKWQR